MRVVMADDIDDLINCIEKKMNTRLKTWDSDDDDDVKSPARSKALAHGGKTTSDSRHKKCVKPLI